MKDIFPTQNSNYNLRNNREFTGRNAKSVRYGTEILSFIGYNIWQQLPVTFKEMPCNPLKTVFKSWYQAAPADYVENTSQILVLFDSRLHSTEFYL